MKLFSIALVAVFLFFPVMKSGPEAYPELLAPSQPEVTDEVFRVLEAGTGTGTAVVTGTLLARPFGEEGRSVYIRVLRSDPAEFAEYFLGMAEEGNSVNGIEDERLLFRLGMLNAEGKFSSTAAVGKTTQKEILTALATGEPVELVLTIPLYAGTGAPEEFSFAGSIQAIRAVESVKSTDKGGE